MSPYGRIMRTVAVVLSIIGLIAAAITGFISKPVIIVLGIALAVGMMFLGKNYIKVYRDPGPDGGFLPDMIMGIVCYALMVVLIISSLFFGGKGVYRYAQTHFFNVEDGVPGQNPDGESGNGDGSERQTNVDDNQTGTDDTADTNNQDQQTGTDDNGAVDAQGAADANENQTLEIGQYVPGEGTVIGYDETTGEVEYLPDDDVEGGISSDVVNWNSVTMDGVSPEYQDKYMKTYKTDRYANLKSVNPDNKKYIKGIKESVATSFMKKTTNLKGLIKERNKATLLDIQVMHQDIDWMGQPGQEFILRAHPDLKIYYDLVRKAFKYAAKGEKLYDTDHLVSDNGDEITGNLVFYTMSTKDSVFKGKPIIRKQIFWWNVEMIEVLDQYTLGKLTSYNCGNWTYHGVKPDSQILARPKLTTKQKAEKTLILPHSLKYVDENGKTKTSHLYMRYDDKGIQSISLEKKQIKTAKPPKNYNPPTPSSTPSNSSGKPNVTPTPISTPSSNNNDQNGTPSNNSDSNKNDNKKNDDKKNDKNNNKNQNSSNSGNDGNSSKDQSKNQSSSNNGGSSGKADASSSANAGNNGGSSGSADSSSSSNKTNQAGSSSGSKKNKKKETGQSNDVISNDGDINGGGNGKIDRDTNPEYSSDGSGAYVPPSSAINKREEEEHKKTDETKKEQQANSNGNTITKEDNYVKDESGNTAYNPVNTVNKEPVKGTPDEAEKHDKETGTDKETGQSSDAAQETVKKDSNGNGGRIEIPE